MLFRSLSLGDSKSGGALNCNCPSASIPKSAPSCPGAMLKRITSPSSSTPTNATTRVAPSSWVYSKGEESLGGEFAIDAASGRTDPCPQPITDKRLKKSAKSGASALTRTHPLRHTFVMTFSIQLISRVFTDLNKTWVTRHSGPKALRPTLKKAC